MEITRPLGGLRAVRGLLVIGLVLGLLPLSASPALAAQSATASVDKKLNHYGQTSTYTFTVDNTSSAAETLPSVRIGRPSNAFTIDACPQAPAGWTSTVWTAPGGGPDPAGVVFCRFDSAAGPGDDIPAGGTSTFQVTATIDPGSQTATGVWDVQFDTTDTFDILDGSMNAAGPGNSLDADLYGIELTDVVVRTTTIASGATCPSPHKVAPPNSTRVLVVCGKVHANTTFNAQSGASDVYGPFVDNDNGSTSGNVGPTTNSVVLATYDSAGITSSLGSDMATIAVVGDGSGVDSPPTTFTGYSTDPTPPPAPSAPDLVAASDTGSSSTDDVTNDNTPTFGGTAEANSTVEILDGGTVRATATAAGDGSYTATVPGASVVPDGPRSITARATDPAGNTGAESAALAITVDTAAPANPSIGTSPGVTGSDETPTWGFSGEGGAVFTCKLDHPDSSQAIDNSCISAKTFDVTAGNDGTYTFRVSQTDVAGNPSGENTDTYLLDRQAPADPTITTRPAEDSSNPVAEWTFSGEAGGTFECVLLRPDSTQENDATCASPKSYDLSTRPDGLYTFRARQTDGAGGQSGWTTDTFTLDRVAPSAPTITAEPPPRTNNPTAVWNFSGEAGGSFECVLTKPGGAEVTDANCPGPKNYDLSGDADGLYTFQVRQIDASGNPSAYQTSTFTLDRQAPSAPTITARPADVTTNEDPEWTFTGEFGASYECVLVRPDSTEITVIPCTSPTTFGLAVEADGAYTYKVRQIDVAGNPGPYATDDFTLDRVAPSAPSITAEPPARTNNPTVGWSFNGEAGATFECVLVKPDTSEVTDPSCTSPKDYDLSGESDGLYTFRVRQTDRAGLQGGFATDTFTLDRQAPVAPTITASPPPRTNNSNAVWGFSGEAGGTFECEITKPGGAQVTDSTCSDPKSYDLSGDGDGFYTFRVRVTDEAGNAGPFATSTFTLDRQAPADPSITARPANVTSNASPQWTYTGEFGASYECVLVRPDSIEITSVPCFSPQSFDLAAESDGAYTFKVRQIDSAGNVGPYATDDFTLDRVAPATPTITTEPPARTNDDTPAWAFSGEAGGSYECVLTRPDASQVTDTSCSSSKSYDLTSLTDGLYTFQVRQTDAAGSQSPYATDTFTLDRVAPVAPTITSAPPTRTNDDTPTWGFSGEAGGSYECVLTAPGGAQTTDSTCSGPKSYDVSGGAEGLYTFQVRQSDGAGNTGAYSTSTFTLDRIAPTQPSITARPANFTSNQNPQWTFSGEAGGTYECVLVRPDSTEINSTPCTSPKSFDLTAEVDGAYTFKVRQTDAAGNTGSFATDDFTLDRVVPSAPSITTQPVDDVNNPVVQWTFTGEPSATYECVLIRPDLTVINDNSCSSPKTIDLSGETDGIYTFRVRQIDQAGLQSPYSNDSFTLDRQAPDAPTITGAPPGRTNNATATWNFTNEVGGRFECEITKPGGAQITDATCSAPKTYNLTGDADGLYTFRVRQIDNAGSAGAYATSTFTLDRIAPAAPSITTRPANFTTDDNPQWTFTGELGASYECVLVRPDASEINVGSCVSPITFPLDSESDGAYTFKVRQTDIAGNTGVFGTDDFTLDRVPPVAPSILSRPPNDVNVSTVQWTFSGEPTATFECVLVRPDNSEVTDASCSSPKTIDLATYADGTYTFKVRQADRAGQSGPYATDVFVLDRQPPGAPTITEQPPPRTNDATPRWSFTGEPGGSFECVIVRPGGSETSTANCVGPRDFDFSAEIDGLYTFKVRQTDAAGSAGPFAVSSYTLDRQAPLAPVIGTRPSNSTNDPDPVWTFTGEFGASYECVLVRSDNSQIGPVSCGSPFSFAIASELDGTFTFKVRQTDIAGNTGAYATDDFTLDRVAPEPPILTGRPTTFTSNSSAEWRFYSDHNDHNHDHDGDGDSDDDDHYWWDNQRGTPFHCILTRPDGSTIQFWNICRSPEPYNLASEPDGTYTFRVRQLDDAGNQSAWTSDAFTLDRQAPAAPAITSAPPVRSNDDTPTWGFTGEFGATYTCVLVRPDGTENAPVACTSPDTSTLTAAADGLYTFKVRQTDRAGNTGPFATSSYTLDRVAPVAPTITAQPPARTNDDTPTWNFTGEPGGTYECVIVQPDNSEIGPAVCTSPRTYDFTTGADGLYTFKVRQIDGATNTGVYATASYTLDRQAPVAPAITAEPATRTNDDTPTWNFTGEAGATYECVLTKPGGTLITDTSCISEKGYDLTADTDGLYTFRVRQTDVAGNTGVYATDTFTLDRVAPVAPSITAQPPARINDDTPTWSFSGEVGGTYQCVIVRPDGTEIGPASCSTPKTFDLTGEADGFYTFKVRQTDVATNTGVYATSSYTLDRVAPVAPTITSQPPARINDFTPTWSFTGEPGGTYECAIVRPDGTEIGPSSCTTPRTYDLSAEADGLYTFKVRQTDVATNTGAYATSSYTLDRIAPVAPSITNQPPARINDFTPTWDFDGEPGGTYECALVRPDGSEIGPASCTSPRTYDLSTEADGPYTFKVRQTDVATNTGVYATASYTLDRVAPVAPSITAQPPVQINDDTPTWDFNGEAGGTYECVVVRPDGTEIGPASCSISETYDLSAEADGLYTFKVRQTDVATNTGVHATASYTLDRVAPVAPAITGRPAEHTPDEAPRWTFTGEFGASYECVLVRPDDTEVTTIPCTSPASFALSVEVDGDYTFKVKQIDAAGNPGPYATDDFELDRQPPVEPVIGSRPPEDVRVNTLEWSFSGEPTSVFECVLVKPDLSEDVDPNCTSPKSIDLTNEPDGDYTFKIRQTDDAGHPSPYITDAFTLDRQAPAAPVVTARPLPVTNDDTPEWSFVGEPSGSFECAYVRPDGTETAPIACASPKGFSLQAGPDGIYTFKVRQTDDAGNVGPFGSSSFELDRQRPSAPAVTALPPNLTSNTLPRWIFRNEAGATVRCVLVRPDATEIVDASCTSPKVFSLRDEADGAYTFKVRQTDVAGNTGPFAVDRFTLDRASAASVITSEPPAFTNNPLPQWEFAGEANGSFECALVKPNGLIISSPTCSSPKGYDLKNQADGFYTFKVRQTDAAFNHGIYAESSLTLDRQAPAAPTISARPAELSNDLAPGWQFSGEPGATYECVLMHSGVQAHADACSSPTSLPWDQLPDGNYTFKVRQTDEALNTGGYSSDNFTLDRTAPSAPTFTSEPPADTNDPTLEWNFSGEGGGTFECALLHPDGTEVTSSSCTGPKGHDLSADPDGVYMFMVRQTDDAGNTGNYAASTVNLDRQAPATPTIQSTPLNFYDVAAEWAFSGEVGATYECVLVRVDGSERSKSCTSPAIFDMSTEADGDYVFKVRQTDAAGNVGGFETDDHYFNKTPPTPQMSGGAPSLTNDPTHEVAIAGEPGAVFQCTLINPNGSETEATCPSPYTLDMASKVDGTYTLSIRQFIGVNGSLPVTQTFTIDRFAAQPSLEVDPGVAGSDPTPVWTFNGEVGATLECVLVDPDGTEVTQSDCQAPIERDLTALPDGDYGVMVRQVDPAGNESAFAEQTYELDRVAPEAPVLRSAPDGLTRDLAPSWSFSGEDEASFICTLTAPSGNMVSDDTCPSLKSFGLSREEGLHTFSVVQRDRAGNESAPTVSKTRLDLSKPEAKGLRVGPKRFMATGSSSIAIGFGRSEPATATIKIVKAARTLMTYKEKLGKSRISLRWHTKVGGRVIKPGRYKVVVILKDRVGWTSKASTPFTART